MTLCYISYRIVMQRNLLIYMRACTGFDRDSEDGEAIRRQMRQIANLKLNADENYALAA